MDLKGLKLLDIENNGYTMTLKFEGGFILHVEYSERLEELMGTISKIVYEEVGTI